MMSCRGQPGTTPGRKAGSRADEAETGGSLNMGNREHDPLIPRNSNLNTNAGSSTSTELLVLIGPALLAGYTDLMQVWGPLADLCYEGLLSRRLILPSSRPVTRASVCYFYRP